MAEMSDRVSKKKTIGVLKMDVITPVKTYYLFDEWDFEKVVFELLSDKSVEKIYPILAITDLTEQDLEEWLEEDLKSGHDSFVLEQVSHHN